MVSSISLATLITGQCPEVTFQQGETSHVLSCLDLGLCVWLMGHACVSSLHAASNTNQPSSVRQPA